MWAFLFVGLVSARFKSHTDSFSGTPAFKSSHELFASDTEITLQWRHAENSGFNVYSQIEKCEIDHEEIWARKLALHPTYWDQKEFKETIIQDGDADGDWWTCTETDTALVIQTSYYTFTSLAPSTLYRFRVKQLSLALTTSIASDYSDPILMTTAMAESLLDYEKIQLQVRGTGLNNHWNSVIRLANKKLGETKTFLESSKFRGLYLAVFNRRNLDLVRLDNYELMEKQSTQTLSDGTYTEYTYTKGTFTDPDDFSKVTDT